ncbi:hypothetical protein QJS10_CPA16g01129 [Acorus calamus]|uniref:Uncharacterized protein n=1 Tax=Acorus calamus TaxID=4465 RepID=A0AAV9D1Z6_ACOCL|nr:hypothetical protein QJS10_CPA16g01129 [Acorus calamus]
MPVGWRRWTSACTEMWRSVWLRDSGCSDIYAHEEDCMVHLAEASGSDGVVNTGIRNLGYKRVFGGGDDSLKHCFTHR